MHIRDHVYCSVIRRMINVGDKNCRENQNTFFFNTENRAVYEIMWKNVVVPDRLQMTI